MSQCIKCRKPATRTVLVSLIDGTVEHEMCERCFVSFKTMMAAEGAVHHKVSVPSDSGGTDG